ncbi:MAG: CocE/NonD family hydrolase [Myxococcota bacterium]
MSWIARKLGVRAREHRPRCHDDVAVVMRDDVALRTRRWSPADGGRRPAVVIRTPYGIGWNPPLPLLPFLARLLAGRGYHVVLQDTRGRYRSQGRFAPFVHEREDGLDTLDWVAEQPWCDGRIGMWGASYFGYTQWAVSAAARPYLKALVPIVTSTDFHGLFYPGGAFSLLSSLRWAASNGDRRGRRAPERRLPAAARVRPMADAVRAARRHAPFFDDWVEHPERDDYWAGVDLPDARSTSRVPALSIAGTWDIFGRVQLDDYAAMRDSTWLDLGPFAHGSYAVSPRKLGWKQAGFGRLLPASLEFLDHHLMDRPLERDRVRRYVVGEDRWVEEPEWPPPGTRELRLFLRGDGRATREPPGRDEASRSYAYDPEDPVPTRGGSLLGPRAGPDDQRGLEQRADVRTYETEPLSRPLCLAGPVSMRLVVSTDAEATDFTAKLVHLPRDESAPAINLCDGIRRVARAQGGTFAVEIGMWPVSAVLPAGDRLRIEVSSSNFPRYDAHPNVPGNPAHATATKVARQTLHHGADAPSFLSLRAMD